MLRNPELKISEPETKIKVTFFHSSFFHLSTLRRLPFFIIAYLNFFYICLFLCWNMSCKRIALKYV